MVPIPALCPGLTSDGVGVVVPGLLRDVEDAGGHRPCPAWQFAAGDHGGRQGGSTEGRIWPAGTALPSATCTPSYPRDPCHLPRTPICTLAPFPRIPPTSLGHYPLLQCTHPLPRIPTSSPGTLTLFSKDHYHLPRDPHPSPGPPNLPKTRTTWCLHCPQASLPSTLWLHVLPGQDEAPKEARR